MTSDKTRINPVDLVTASAGTGKTTRLSEEIELAIRADVDPRAILATTFTNKAAGELAERARGRLIDDGVATAATGLLGAQMGTVNSVFGKLVGQFALEAGRSPVADVIAEDRINSVFAVATEPAVIRYAGQLIPIAQRLSIDNWEDDLQKICALTRQNDVPVEDLATFADKSWNGLSALLAKPSEENPDMLNQALANALRASAIAIDSGSDTTKTTQGVRARIRDALSIIDSGRPLPWAIWAQLSKLKPAVASQEAVATVLDAAGCHPAHPGLHQDLEQYIRGVFACAAEALLHYQRFKETTGLVDFIDQEHQALRLLERPDVVERLTETTQLAYVDEFQDTSPIQLALFLKIAQIVERSFWVGDPKQAIYGFRGADPELMTEAVRHIISSSGGTTDTLATSYRSRPDLVKFANAAFVPAFQALGFDEASVRIKECARKDGPGQPDAIELWALAGSKWETAIGAMAAQLRSILDNAEQYPVVKRGTDETRALKGSDIAILCRNNDRCSEVARALADAGLRVSIGRPGLLSTPEAIMAVAGLRYLVDENDSLAVAEIAHLSWEGDEQADWLERSLALGGLAKLKASLAPLTALDQARAKLAYLTPRESMETAIAVAKVSQRAKEWGSAVDRVANLDALRGLAVDYEDECRTSRSAATAAGLVSWLTKVADGGNQPPSTDPDAVNVLTYHRAKGLEWPMVVLLDLDTPREPRLFSPTIEKESDFDIWQPLAGRCIRFWPWPYGQQRKDVHLDATAAASDEMAEAGRREYAENVRLLYVGITRARDYLVLAPRKTAKGAGWLEALCAESGQAVVDVSHALDDQIITAGDKAIPLKAIAIEKPEAYPAAAEHAQQVYTIPDAPEAGVHLPLRVIPSAQQGNEEPFAKVGEIINLGGRLPLSGQTDMVHLGQAVHGFLAVDRPYHDKNGRLARAKEILERWHVNALQPEQLLIASERLYQHVDSAHPGMQVMTEVPVHGRLGLQRASGIIDLLLINDADAIVIDHKTFPGAYDTWEPRALTYAPQLALYRDLVAQAAVRSVSSCWIHMPVIGKLIELQLLQAD